MFTKEQGEKILDWFNNQTKYKTKKDFLLAVREHLEKNLFVKENDVKSR